MRRVFFLMFGCSANDANTRDVNVEIEAGTCNDDDQILFVAGFSAMYYLLGERTKKQCLYEGQ